MRRLISLLPPWEMARFFRGRERGQVMVITLLAVAFGVVVMVPLLLYLSGAALSAARFSHQTEERYAAEAAIKRVLADIIRGADAVGTTYYMPAAGGGVTYTITTTYTVPSVTVSDFTVTAEVSAAPSGSGPTPQQAYFDPGTLNGYLKTVLPKNGYLMRFFNVYTGTLQVNWAYTPDNQARVAMWRGAPTKSGTPIPPGLITDFPTDQPILDTGSTSGAQSYVRSAALSVGPGIYTIVFWNLNANVTVTTADFQPSGGAADTWVYAIAFRDYIITATVGSTTVSTFVRQMPGYTQPPTTDWSVSNTAFLTNTVLLSTWTPP